MKNYRNKTVYITGGSSGIGFAVACEFLKLGANVLIIARDKTKLSKAAEKLEIIKKDKNQSILTLSLDISSVEDVNEAFNKNVLSIGPPDLLVNCAGISYPDYFEKISYEIFTRIIDINLKGTWNLLQALVPKMKEKGGTIVNVSSIAGFIGVFGYSAYGASKYGLIGISEVLYSELKKYNIHVSVLCPPDTDTPQFAEEEKTKPPETKAIAGTAKLMTPEAVANSLIKGIERKKFMIIPGFSGKFIYFMKRHFPGLVQFIIDKDVKKVQKNPV